MEFVPPVPAQEKPNLGSVLMLILMQVGLGIGFALIGQLLPLRGSGFSGVAALGGAMCYAVWAENKRRGCLSNPVILRWLAFYTSIVQVLLALPLLGAVFFHGGARLGYWLVGAGAVVFALLASFLISWLGLAQGRKVAERSHQKKDRDRGA